jgi:anaerobic ribonucleoside-triphosphate reductase activating protein
MKNVFRFFDQHVELALQDGSVALYDRQDHDVISSYSTWTHDRDYVITMCNDNSKRKKISMHRVIMGTDNPAVMVDHINGNGLDNRRLNLRLCDNKHNQENRRGVPSDNTSGIRGVSWRKDRSSWECQIQIRNRTDSKRERTLRKLVKTLSEAKAVMIEGRRKNFTHCIESKPAPWRLMSILNNSQVNGPGDRLVIWTQGCPHACKGCFNPESWNFSAGEERDAWDVAIDVLNTRTAGITISGGEPFWQPQALLSFLKGIHDDNNNLIDLPKGIICFTGYTIEEIFELPGVRGDAARACLDHIDLLIDGRFEENLRVDHVLAGSSNQRFHFLDKPGRGRDKINPEEVQIDQAVEIHLGKDSLEVTGFPTISRSWLKERGLRILP